jgi:hypothetical protein
MNPFLAALPPILFGALQLTILLVAIRVTRAEHEWQLTTPLRIETPAPSDDNFPQAA